MKRLILVLALIGSACSGTGASSTNAQPPGAAPLTTGSSLSGSGPSSTADSSGSNSAPSSGGSTLACWGAPVQVQDPPGTVALEDVTDPFGLVEPLTGMYGHAAAFGDVNGDSYPDLAVGTFTDRPVENYQLRGADGPSPDRLLLGGDTFTPAGRFSPDMGRTSGAVFADFDGDGDPDLLLVRNDDEEPPPAQMFENVDGVLKAVAEPLPDLFNGRTPAVADYDGDGLLDVYVAEDRYGEMGGVLLHNEGGFAFTDVTARSGLKDVHALGATAADLNGDGIADLVTSENVFLGNGDMSFTDATPPGFGWEQIGPDDDPAGVAVGDVNNDGRPDILVGQHYRSIVEEGARVPIRLFLNRGLEKDRTSFEEVTKEAGLDALPSLAPHVEFADMDNDGRPDIITSGSAADGDTPAIFRNLGGDPVRFEAPAGMGNLQYWVGAPVADVDHDGRLDVFALEWEPALPSRLYRNVTSGGHWLEVSVDDPLGGVGTVVEVDGPDGSMLGRQEIGVAVGYASGTMPVAHFGLGANDQVAVKINTATGESAVLKDVSVDSHIRWPNGC